MTPKTESFLKAALYVLPFTLYVLRFSISRVMNKKNNLLIIYVKAPRAGMVKTRLLEEFSAEEALALYRAMAKDLIARLRDSRAFTLQVHFAPEDAAEELQSWLGGGLILRPQQGRNLGERMHGSFAAAFREGFQKTAIIGSDLPTLTHSRVIEAFRQLDWCEMVLGPAEDGGYYLIALKSPQPELFEEVEWSSPAVLSRTLENASRGGLKVIQLPRERDLDTPADARRLWENFRKKAVQRKLAPRTFAVLAKQFPGQ